MFSRHFLIVYFIFLRINLLNSRNHCNIQVIQEKRHLNIVTCETLGNSSKPRYKSLGFLTGNPLKLWNISSIPLIIENKAFIANICGGQSWDHGVFTKSMNYHRFVKSLMEGESTSHLANEYVLLTDSDTLWSVDRVSELWRRFDCVRDQAEVVISSELTCSMGGFYCTSDTIAKWYSNISNIPSSSVFVNSGVIMGKASIVYSMLEFILANNKSYYSYHAFDKKWRFHDQHAVSDYALRIAPKGLFAIDYHQQLSGNFGIRLPGSKTSKAKFVCKRSDGTIDYHCVDKTNEIALLEPRHFIVNQTTCAVHRRVVAGQQGYSELQSLAPDPAIWHGNGGSKKVFVSIGKEVYRCLQESLQRPRQASIMS
jgi:hypothetical protein